MRRLALVLVVVLLSHGLPASERPSPEPKLAVTVRSMKPSYRIGENIRLEIQLANIGHEAFVIRRQLGWGVRRTEIHMFDSNGKEVFTSVLADQLPPPQRARLRRVGP